jgi:MoxR-like ATPase
MTDKQDFIYIFQDYDPKDLQALPIRFRLLDFNFMITSQRTMARIHEKLEDIDQKKVSPKVHGNFWIDLRVLGLAKEDGDEISQFGKVTLEYFRKEKSPFKREHFILSNIRKRNFDISKKVYDNYFSKVENLGNYLNVIPTLNQKGKELLLNEEKIFFTECLNTFPKALNRYFSLPPDRQVALDSLHESGLKNLFDPNIPKEAPYAKVARRFWNVCRAYGRRTNFIKSVILSEYEEKVSKSKYHFILLEVLSNYAKILNEDLLVKVIKKSEVIQPAIGLKTIEETPIDDKPLPMPSKEEIQEAVIEIRKLLLIEDNVVTQIISNLVSGKNIIIAGPVGTGKTHLAILISKLAWKKEGGYYPEVATATADWTTHEVIGGVHPKVDEEGNVKYVVQRGCVYDSVARNWTIEGTRVQRKKVYVDGHEYEGVWLIIDEFNRANIDRAFGEMFTAIEHGKLKVPTSKEGEYFEEISIPKDYRIIGTLNTFDKHYLFRLSDALKRRFAFVELFPPGRDKVEEEKYYVLKRALEELANKPPISGKIVLNHEKKIIVRNKSDPDFLFLIDSAYEIMSFIRCTKNLGTAILISMFKFIIVDSFANDNPENSLDVALKSNIVPQLENVSKWSLEAIKAFACESMVDFFKNVSPDSIDFNKYEMEFLKLIHPYLAKDNVQGRMERFKKGQISENEWKGYDPWMGKTRPKLPLFQRSLTELIQEVQLI